MEVSLVSPEPNVRTSINKHGCTCTCIHTERTLKFVKLGICICLFLAVVSVSACVIAVRSAVYAHEQLQLVQRDMQYRPKEQTVEVRSLQDTLLQFQAKESSPLLHQSEGRIYLSRDRRGTSKSKNSRKDKNKRKHKFCKKVSKCESSMTTKTAPDTLKKELIASEFQVDGSNVYGQNIGAFVPAKWINANVKPAAEASENELFVTESGVYLVYSSVLFNDTKYREGLVVQKNGGDLFKCFDGVDHIDTNKTRTQNFKFKTCSVSGVTYLAKGDTLRMLNLYRDTHLDTSPGSTFIGLIQLIPARSG